MPVASYTGNLTVPVAALGSGAETRVVQPISPQESWREAL